MPKRERRPTPPGEILREFYLQPRGLSVSRFARAADLTRKHVSNIVNGRASITSETAVRFAEVLKTTPQFWLNLQNAVDLFDARRKLGTWRPAETHASGTATD